MRPRVFPAEDARPAVLSSPDLTASMRPRVFPAEDLDRRQPHVALRRLRFNEAAGIPRGRRTTAIGTETSSPPRFNEAAGIPRGRR